MTSPPRDFRDRALCRDADPESFYPVGDAWTGDANAARAARGKALCAACPVRTACLTDGIARGDKWALLGATLPDERRAHGPARPAATTAVPAVLPSPEEVQGGRPRGRPRRVGERHQPTGAQGRALLAALDNGGRLPRGVASGSTAELLVADGYVVRRKGAVLGRPGTYTWLTERGHAAALDCREAQTRAARDETIGASA